MTIILFYYNSHHNLSTCPILIHLYLNLLYFITFLKNKQIKHYLFRIINFLLFLIIISSLSNLILKLFFLFIFPIIFLFLYWNRSYWSFNLNYHRNTVWSIAYCISFMTLWALTFLNQTQVVLLSHLCLFYYIIIY